LTEQQLGGCNPTTTTHKNNDLERQLIDTQQELTRLRDVMQRVGAIANTLFNSCSSTMSSTELEKLWALQAK